MVDSSRYIALRLQKEKQDEDQQLAKQALQQRQMQMILSTGMDAAQGIAGAMKTSKQNGVANALMNQQTPPRAEAVDPALNAQMRQQGLGPTAPRAGGLDELKLSMAMEDQRNQNMASQLGQQRMQIAGQRMDDTYNHQRIQDAIAAAKLTSEKTKSAVTDSAAYFKNIDVMRDKLAEAQKNGDFRAYNTTATEMQALHTGNVSAGLKLPPLVIPDFSGPAPENEGAFNSAMDNWQNTRGAAMQKDGWDEGSRSTKTLNPLTWANSPTPSNGERFMKASEELNKQKAGFVKRPVDKYQPEGEDVIPLPTQQSQSATPTGQVIRNKATGQMMRWNGQAWENI